MNTYKIVGKFKYCRKLMTIVMMNRSACAISKREFNRIIEMGRKGNRE